MNRDCVQSMVLLICMVLFLLVSVKLSNVLIEKTKMALQAGHGLRLTTEDAGGNVNAKWHYKERSWYGFIANIDTFTPKSDQFRISPAASPEITHHTVWRNVAFHSLLRWEIGGMSFLNLGVKGLIPCKCSKCLHLLGRVCVCQSQVQLYIKLLWQSLGVADKVWKDGKLSIPVWKKLAM